MSNIDKRALREIAEAAVGAHERLSVMPPDDIFDISLAEGTQLDADITALNALNSAANPATVLALLDELEAKDRQILKLQKLAEAESVGADKAATSGVEWMKLYHAAEKRIAELEGREVVLPSAHDVHPLGPQSAKIFCEFHRSIVNRCADEIRKVGVKVSIKGN